MNISKEEEILVSLGAERYQHKLEQLRENNMVSLTSFGSKFIKDSLEPVADLIESHIKTVKETCLLPADQLAFIGLTTVINYLEPDMKFSTLCFKVGASVVDEYNAQQFGVPSGLSRNQLISKLRKHKAVAIKKSQRLRIGVLILSAIESKSCLINFHYKTINMRKFRVVSPTEDFLQYYNEFMQDSVYSQPLKKPIPSFPIQFNNKLVGGYAFDVLNNKSSLKYRESSQVEKIISKGDITKVRNVMNKVQSIPYEINSEVLDIVWHLYTNDKEVASLPPKPTEIPKMDKDASEEEKSIFLRKFYQLKESNNSILGKRFNIARTLMVAKESEELDHFYFPCYTDFRGRIYYHGDYLNPQGADLAKALLKFKSKSVITEDYWYFVHGANCFGKSKLSYPDRYKFIKDYESSIKAIAENPIKNSHLWENSDSPFEFLAFCLDCAEYLKNPDTYKSGLRISSDASSSGLQILSLLLKDKEGCVRTNVLPGDTDKPSDVYIECVGILERIMKSDFESDLKPVSGYALYWREFFVGKDTRSLVKRILMTSVYSLSTYGLRSYVKEWISDNRKVTGEDMFEYDSYLCKRVTEAVKDTVKGASLGMDYIKEVTKLLSNNNLDLEVTLPNGFVMVSSYKKFKDKKIKLKTQKGYMYVNFKDKGTKIQKGKSVNASVPNYIHALDASILYDVINTISNALPFSLVHDSVYYRAGDADTFYVQIRESMVNIFSKDLLEDFKTQIEEMSGLKLPEVPKIGEINIEEIIESPYIYH